MNKLSDSFCTLYNDVIENQLRSCVHRLKSVQNAVNKSLPVV